MSYRSFISNGNMFFMIGDDTVIDFNSHENVETLVKASEKNLENLILEIKEGLINSANKELELMEAGTPGNLTETLAYGKIMNMLNQYIYIENERKKFEEAGNVSQERWLSEDI